MAESPYVRAAAAGVAAGKFAAKHYPEPGRSFWRSFGFSYKGDKKPGMAATTPQSNIGDTKATGGLADPPVPTNPASASFTTSYLGISSHNISINGTEFVGQNFLTFDAYGGNAWNRHLLLPVAAALDLYNYYTIDSVELVLLPNLVKRESGSGGGGLCMISLTPWTGEYLVGSTFPDTNTTLLENTESFTTGFYTIDRSSIGYGDLQRVEHFMVKPQYQQNASGTTPVNLKAQYSNVPLQILSRNGIDTTEWYGILWRFESQFSFTGASSISIPYIYKVTITLSGRRWTPIPTSLRQSSTLGDHTLGHGPDDSLVESTGKDATDGVYDSISATQRYLQRQERAALSSTDKDKRPRKKKRISSGDTEESLDIEYL